MVRLENIKVIYHKNTPLAKVVLDNINLEIKDSEFVAITGGNGAGKSTIAKLIAGEIPCANGKIFINEQDCTKLGVVARSSMIARVFQDPMRGTAPELTVLENMAFAAKRGTKRGLNLAINPDIRHYFAERLHQVDMDLESKLDYRVSSLSGGQRQALSLIMATLCPAKLLILDEHTAALSLKAARTIMDLTHKIIREQKLAALMITHNPVEAERSDRILHLDNGKLD